MDLKADTLNGHVGGSRKRPRIYSHSLPIEGKFCQKNIGWPWLQPEPSTKKEKGSDTKLTLNLREQLVCALHPGTFCQEMLRLV